LSAVEAIERATVLAVSPDAQAEIPGWVLPFDAGTVGRAKSAVPLAHAAPDPAVLDEIEARYAQHGLPVMLRIPVMPAFDPFRAQLLRQRYREETPTEVQTAIASSVRVVSDGEPAELLAAPSPDWASVFLGEGFDAVDGANRVQKLGQADGSLFALIREAGRSVAAGAAAFSHGWVSVHGMRTAQACRGRGLAARVLATLAGAAIDRGFQQVFLQVSAENTVAKSLYRRAGFEHAWTYSYWRKQL
jgi:ribosomal protein S18 acetylase RimI-like enzyme